jgi:hypothetical protein
VLCALLEDVLLNPVDACPIALAFVLLFPKSFLAELCLDPPSLTLGRGRRRGRGRGGVPTFVERIFLLLALRATANGAVELVQETAYATGGCLLLGLLLLCVVAGEAGELAEEVARAALGWSGLLLLLRGGGGLGGELVEEIHGVLDRLCGRGYFGKGVWSGSEMVGL